MGRGKGKKGGGKKGKGKHQAPAEEEGWEGGAQGAAAEQHLYRIKNRYHVAHAILKTACDQEGSAFAKQHKTNDFAFLGGKSLKALLTRDNHHLLRRPGVGLSEAAGSLQAGADVLQNLMDLDISILQQVLQEEQVVAALRLLNTLDPSVERAPKDLQGAVATLAETLTGVEGVEEAAIKVTIMASRLYLFGMQLLPLLHGFSDPGWWAEAIPETSNKALRSWQAAPTSKSKMAKALAAMVSEKLETASGPSANDAAALFGRSSKKPVVASSSSEREKTKKKKTNKDKKKKRSSKSSSSSSEGKKKKKNQDKSKKEKKRKAASSEDSEKAVSEESRAEKKHKKDKKDKSDKRKTSSASTEPNRKKDKAKKKEEKPDKQDKKRKRRSSEESNVADAKERKQEQKRHATRQAEKEKKEAAYTAWELGQLQVFLSAVEAQHGNMANLPEARFPVQELQDFVAQIPGALQAYGPVVANTEEAHVPAAEAKNVLGDIMRLAKDAEKFLTQESRMSASKSGGLPGK